MKERTTSPLPLIAAALAGVFAAIVPMNGCGGVIAGNVDGSLADASTASDAAHDAGAPDSGRQSDSGVPPDAGSTKPDAGSIPTDAGGTRDGGTSLWVMGYWANWQTTQYPINSVNWSDLTHVALSFVLPRAPGAVTTNNPYATLDINNFNPTQMAAFAAAAHGGGVKAIMSLGGAGAGPGFAAAASAANQSQFISDVLAACAQWGFDGIDLDWEDAINYADFQSFIQAIRPAAPNGFVITAPVGAVNTNFGISASDQTLWQAVYPLMDQINVMDYTGTGHYQGWVVWFFDPLYGSGGNHPVDVSTSLAAWAALGIPKSKLGIGVGFYGAAVGPPVTAPLQSFGDAGSYEDDSIFSSGNIARYFIGKGGAVYSWDNTAMAGYLSWTTPYTPNWSDQYGTSNPPPTITFLTYEDAAGIAAKGQWVKANGYGGAIIWTINEGTQFPYGGDGYLNPLLDAMGTAFLQ